MPLWAEDEERETDRLASQAELERNDDPVIYPGLGPNVLGDLLRPPARAAVEVLGASAQAVCDAVANGRVANRERPVLFDLAAAKHFRASRCSGIGTDPLSSNTVRQSERQSRLRFIHHPSV